MSIEYKEVIFPNHSICRVVRIGPSIWVSTTLVTQIVWTSVMGDNPSCFTGEYLPVESVSWTEAMAFCEQAAKKVLVNGKSVDGTVRLPLEAEWKGFANDPVLQSDAFDSEVEQKRISARHRSYCNTVGWFRRNSGGHSHVVGEKISNHNGLFDTYGNVWEWLLDMDTPFRIYRGGGWNTQYHYLLNRCFTLPTYKSNDLGFRFILEFSRPN